MKYLIAFSIVTMITTPIYAAPSGYHEETIITSTGSAEVTGPCWAAKGNWVGGESFQSCAFKSGHPSTTVIVVKDSETKDE